MVFGHGVVDESISKPADLFQRGQKHPADIHRPLLVARRGGRLWSLSNRRLASLMIFQALHRDRCMKAWCTIVSDDTERFDLACTTTSEGSWPG
mmetsp:Transcript_105727/g.299054  ORF Transcript_105727/g.299054 Transcript_105727/m.299054 type:complete len:94 (-) Transcript_105727:224-505(-)